MKKLALLGTALVALATYSSGLSIARQVTTTAAVDGTPKLVQRAFAVTRGTPTGFEVHDWSTVPGGFLSAKALSSKTVALLSSMGVHHARGWTRAQAHNHVAFWSGIYKATTDHGVALALKATAEMESFHLYGQPPQTVLVLRLVSDKGELAALAPAYHAVQSAAAGLGGSVVMNAMVFGVLPRVDAQTARTRVVRQAFAAVGGKGTQWLNDAYTTSAAGNSSWPAAFLPTGRDRINLQVALYNNDDHHTTRVLVGSPIITVEY